MGYIDLHIHTTASDGSLTPTEVVKNACNKGLVAIAITDHDTIDGIQEAIDASRTYPVHVIPGIEFSAIHKGMEIHILGYRINFEDEYFVSRINEISEQRYDRNRQICERLAEHGVDITIEKMYERFNSHVLTRANFALYLLEKGNVSTIKEAFVKYIGESAPCYVPRYKIPAEEAIYLIKCAGGIVSIAHPCLYNLDDAECLEFLKEMKRAGADCVEAIYTKNKPGEENKFKSMAKETRLMITGGSDFHGDSKPDIETGTGNGNLMVPGSILHNLGFNFN